MKIISLTQIVAVLIADMILSGLAGWSIANHQRKPVMVTLVGGSIDFTKITHSSGIVIQGDGFRLDEDGLALWGPSYGPPPTASEGRAAISGR